MFRNHKKAFFSSWLMLTGLILFSRCYSGSIDDVFLFYFNCSEAAICQGLYDKLYEKHPGKGMEAGARIVGMSIFLTPTTYYKTRNNDIRTVECIPGDFVIFKGNIQNFYYQSLGGWGQNPIQVNKKETSIISCIKGLIDDGTADAQIKRRPKFDQYHTLYNFDSVEKSAAIRGWILSSDPLDEPLLSGRVQSQYELDTIRIYKTSHGYLYTADSILEDSSQIQILTKRGESAAIKDPSIVIDGTYRKIAVPVDLADTKGDTVYVFHHHLQERPVSPKDTQLIFNTVYVREGFPQDTLFRYRGSGIDPNSLEKKPVFPILSSRDSSQSKYDTVYAMKGFPQDRVYRTDIPPGTYLLLGIPLIVVVLLL